MKNKKNMFYVKRVALYKLGDCKQNITSLSLLVGTTVFYAFINMAEVHIFTVSAHNMFYYGSIFCIYFCPHLN